MVTSNYNRLVVNSGIEDCEGNEMIFLFKDKEVSEIAYNDGSYSTLYILGDLYVERADDVVYKEDFDNNLYYEADETDKKENIVMLDSLYDVELKPYVKADWSNHDHYLRLASEHGINVSVYDFKDDVEILEGQCYMATGYISQNYPHTEHQDFFKFVANNGKEYYIKRTTPFFLDDFDYQYELITKELFEEYA